MLTFLSTILKQPAALNVLEHAILWQELATFFCTIPRKIMVSQGLFGPRAPPVSGDRWPMLTSSVSPPLSEDWCMRGMEWVGRKVFERGYWKSGDDRKAELEVLEQDEGMGISYGTIEDDEDEDGSAAKAPKALSELERRWIRIARAAVTLSGCVEGLEWKEGTREWSVEGKLAQKVEQWKEEDRSEKLEEERRRMRRRWTDDAMEIDEAEMEDGSFSDDDDDENGPE
jgi:protein SMG6